MNVTASEHELRTLQAVVTTRVTTPGEAYGIRVFETHIVNGEEVSVQEVRWIACDLDNVEGDRGIDEVYTDDMLDDFEFTRTSSWSFDNQTGCWTAEVTD